MVHESTACRSFLIKPLIFTIHNLHLNDVSAVLNVSNELYHSFDPVLDRSPSMSMIHMDDSESLKWLTAVILLNLKDLNSDSTLRFIVKTQIPPALTYMTESAAHIVKIRALTSCNDKHRYSNTIDHSFYIYKDPLRPHVMLPRIE